MATLKDREGVDPLQALQIISEECDPETVRAVLAACAVDPDQDIEGHLDRIGLQEGLIVAQRLLTYGLIGDLKKSRLRDLEDLRSEIQILMEGGSRSTSSKSRLSSWGWRLLIFGTFACTSINLFVTLTS
jgi:hypothetical protein